MTIASIKNLPFVSPPTDVEKLKGTKATTLEGEKERLQNAAKEFESFVFNEMLKTMRKTIPESSLSEGSPFSGGMGKDIFTEMFDVELSKKVSNGGRNSISEMLTHQLSKLLEAEYKQDSEPGKLDALNSNDRKLIEINSKNFIETPRKMIPITPTKEPVNTTISHSSSRKKSNNPIIEKYGDLINQAAEAHNLDSALIASVIKAESNGDHKAVSHAGAKGLMQLIDSTASDLGVEHVFNPKENIMGGSRYLKKLYDKYGDVKLALAAYNAGPGNVDKFGGIPPFKETENYVKKVMSNISEFNMTEKID